jgi:hypothetical protein
MAQKVKTKSNHFNWLLLMLFGVSLMYLWSTSESLWMHSDYILMTSDNSFLKVDASLCWPEPHLSCEVPSLSRGATSKERVEPFGFYLMLLCSFALPDPNA